MLLLSLLLSNDLLCLNLRLLDLLLLIGDSLWRWRRLSLNLLLLEYIRLISLCLLSSPLERLRIYI